MEIKFGLKDFNKNAIMKSYGLKTKSGGLQLKTGLKQQITHKIGDNTDLFVSYTFFRRMAKYVPKDTGTLMSTTTIKEGSVTYEVPYAHKQYTTNKGKGIRGSYWDRKVRTNEMKQIANEVENYMKALKNKK